MDGSGNDGRQPERSQCRRAETVPFAQGVSRTGGPARVCVRAGSSAICRPRYAPMTCASLPTVSARWQVSHELVLSGSRGCAASERTSPNPPLGDRAIVSFAPLARGDRVLC